MGGGEARCRYASRRLHQPLLRARETAEIIADRLGLEITGVVPDIREREFGEGEGMLVPDYIRTYGDWHAEVPGAESLHEVGERAIAALHEIARDARRRSAPRAESVIVVAHGGVIRAVIDHVSGGTLPGTARSFRTARRIGSWQLPDTFGCSRNLRSSDQLLL